nr:reverse transcriptase domain-containing protein [Tanacetum cinerariifolium]
MRTRSSSNFPVVSSNPSTLNPKRRNHRRSKQPFILEESPIDTMVGQRTMAELLRAPTEGYAEAIVVPQILAEQFELKHSLINMMTSDQFFRLEKDNPHDHIRLFNKITSTIKYKDVPNSAIKLMLFPFFLVGAARQTTNLRNEISNFQQRFDELFHEAWDRYKDLLRACPHHGFTEFHQLDTFYNALNPADQDSLNAAAGGNLLERQIAKLTHAVNQQTSVVTTNMTAMLKQFQATLPPASVKAVQETCVTCGDAHPYYQCLAAGGNTFLELRDNIQGYVSAVAVNYNQGNPGYRPLGSGSLPSNTIANPNGELKSITTRSGLVIDGPTIPTPPQSINPKVDERVEETFTNPDLTEYTIKVPPPPVQKYKPSSQREYVVHQRDPLHPNIPYPSRMLKQKQQEKDEVQIHKFWQMFKQLHINITLADALILMPKYQKMLKALLSNKEKLQELANTPLNVNFSAVILKKLPKKLGDPRKFLIPCGFSKLKCKALADLGASINLMPLSIWKKLGLPELISTHITLELANRTICTPAGITRDVFVLVGKFTFLADFVIVDYESDPRVPIILGRPFLRTARALIDSHGEEMILRDGDERLILNMRHDTSSYSNQPRKESINLINVFNNSSEEFLKDLFSNQTSGNPTFSSHSKLTLPEVQDDIFNSEGVNVLSEKLLDLNSTKDLHPPLHFDDESDLKEIESLLYQDIDSSLKDSIDQSNLADLANNVVDSVLEMFTDEHALDYSSHPIFDEYDDDFSKIESNTENVMMVLSTPRERKSKRLMLCPQPTTRTRYSTQDFDPPFYETLFFKEVPKLNMLLPFLSENKEKVFKPGIHTSEKVHSSFIP